MRRIQIIIGLMAMALIGLVAFQLYWIDNAMMVNRQKFNRDVHQAIARVVLRLEQQEVINITYRQLKVNAGHVTTRSGSYQVIVSPTPPYGEPAGDVIIAERSSKSALMEPQSDSNRVIRKTEMVETVLSELFGTHPNIHQRIEPDNVDSLLSRELRQVGITADYEFGIYDRLRDSLVFQRAVNTDKPGFKRSTYQAGLFPNDLANNFNVLSLTFPNENSYLLGKIWLPLVSSALLVLVIVFCFGYAIVALLRQKKIGEIKNDFINNMTHEFKTPVSTIALACEALNDKEMRQHPSILDRYLGIIREENSRIGRQVEKVLQIATLDKKELRLKKEPLDLHEIIEKAIPRIAMQVESRGGALEVLLNAEEARVEADETHLTNIVFNLLDNANKYSPENVEIRLETSNTPAGLSLKVSDKGIGMNRDALRRIFEKFYRVPTGNVHDVKGFGLGLAYVKTMVEAHGGTINVESQPGQGSTFEIILPQTHE
ncbi:sensor histidine kinase [Roseivirga sp. BDSF3-8]|uniref:sensor histidine kinase n=1 Tax=Roseivirga sp. BDSF3-8 TaxID=3241598 RepID=UPI0035326144